VTDEIAEATENRLAGINSALKATSTSVDAMLDEACAIAVAVALDSPALSSVEVSELTHMVQLGPHDAKHAELEPMADNTVPTLTTALAVGAVELAVTKFCANRLADWLVSPALTSDAARE